jgi:thiamine-phosphate pyrophosphorylase
VHLGDHDLEVDEARRLLGGDAVIGRTARSPAAALAAVAAGASYLGVGSVFASATKTGLPVIGLAGLRSVADVVTVPVVAIGGIDAERARSAIAAGAAGVAVIAALFAGAPDADRVEKRARTLRAAVESGRQA